MSGKHWKHGLLAAALGMLGFTTDAAAQGQGRTAPKSPPVVTPQRPNPAPAPVIGVVSPNPNIFRPTPTVITPPLYTPPAIIGGPWGPTFIPSTYTPPLAISKDPGKYVTFSNGMKVNPATRTLYNPYTDTFVRPNGTTYGRDPWTGGYSNPLTGGTYNPWTGVSVHPAWSLGLSTGGFSPWTNPIGASALAPNPFLNPNPFVNPNPFLNPVAVNPLVNPNPIGVNNPFAAPGWNNDAQFANADNGFGNGNGLVNLPPVAPLVRPVGAFGPLPGLNFAAR